MDDINVITDDQLLIVLEELDVLMTNVQGRRNDLNDPDDGVVEKARGQLDGGNNRGTVQGQCHTSGMLYPAQYKSSSRNSEMNAYGQGSY